MNPERPDPGETETPRRRRRIPENARPFLKVLGAALVTALITLFLAGFLGGSQRELAQRVDRNAALGRERAEDIQLQLARHRYVVDCLAFSPDPKLKDLRTCLDEASGITVGDIEHLGNILEANLKARGEE